MTPDKQSAEEAEVGPGFVPPVMSLDAYPPVPDQRENRLCAADSTLTPAEWERQLLGELPPCGFRWAWEGSDDDHLHECRHPDDHPGRHVCRCRSWQPRNEQREAAQRVYSSGERDAL